MVLQYFPNAPSISLSGAFDNTYNFSTRVTMTGNLTIRRFAWWATASGGDVPSRFTVWRVGDGVKLYDTTTINATGSAGEWRWTDMDELTLVVGETYSLQLSQTVGKTLPFSSATPTPDSPLTLAGGAVRWYSIVSNSMANTSQSGVDYLAINVDDAGGSSPPTPPAEPPTTEPDPGSIDPGGSLAYWLHKDTVNPDSAVKRIHDWLLNDASGYLAKLTTIEGATAVIGTASSSGESTAMGRLAAILSIVTAAASVTDDVLDAINTVLGWTDDQGAPTALILGRLEYLQGTIGLDWARRNEAITPEVWTLVDTLEWEGPFTWNVPADRYRLHVETVGPFRPVNVVAGLDVLYKLGWWSLLTDTVADERHWLSFRDQDLWVPGVRAPGIIVHPWPEATGTLQAWQRNEPTP